MSTSPTTFPQAVASFEPTDRSVLLWTRLAGGASEATWTLATDPQLTEVVATGTASTGPDRDHTIVVEVDDLHPASTYWYGFEAAGERSPVGRTRTLPTTGADCFRLATVSCARYSVAPLGVYRAVAERDVDLVLHLGDYIYEDDGSKGPRSHEPPHVASSLADYRRRIEQVRSDPDAQALHLRHPMVAIWDDHDLSDNAWRGGAKAHNPERDGDWSTRVAAAAQARQEWLPARLRDPGEPTVTWRSVPIGDLAELVLLDTRLIGRDLHAGDDGSLDLDDPDRSLLGEEQRTWLAERLADVSRSWAVVASGVVVNELELRWPAPLRWIGGLLPNGYAVLDGRVLHDDQWDGYPAERDRLVRELRTRGANGGRTLLLSADVHASWAFEGPIDPDTGAAVAVEVTTPAVASKPMGRAHLPGLWRLLDLEARRMPHVAWAELTERGYCTIDLTPEGATATWWFLPADADGPAADTKPGATLQTRTEAWPPAFEAAPPPAERYLDLDDVHPLPARPDGLRRLRARRRARRAAGPVLATAAALARWALRRRR